MGLFHSTPDLGFPLPTPTSCLPSYPYPYLPCYPYLLPTPASSYLPTPSSYPPLPPTYPYPTTPTSYLPSYLPLPPTCPYLLPTLSSYLPLPPAPYYLQISDHTLPYPHLLTAFYYFVTYLSLPLPLTTSTFFDHLFSPLFQLSSPDPLTTEALLITWPILFLIFTFPYLSYQHCHFITLHFLHHNFYETFYDSFSYFANISSIFWYG